MAAPARARPSFRSLLTVAVASLIAIFAIVNLIAVNQLIWHNNPMEETIRLERKESFLNNDRRSSSRSLDDITKSTTTSRRLDASASLPSRTLPHTGSIQLQADFLYNSTRGSFWLPRPPHPSNIIRGYDVRPSTSNFAPHEYSQQVYNGLQGFITNSQIRVSFSHGFNAGDFFAIFIAPIIAGRPASFRNETQGNKNSICVVGSILSWGIRYMWGPGLIFENKKALATGGSQTTEVVFATRGPHSFQDFASAANKGTILHKVYGDAGSLFSWFYQPHDTTKRYELCIMPHHFDWDMGSPFLKRMNEWWPKETPYRIDIMDPLFKIADEIVQCQFVLCSSLHAIIFSDSYGVPNAHMKWGDNVIGGQYKFDDYYDSIGRQHDWLDMSDESLWKSGQVVTFVEEQKAKYDISKMDLYPFWESCPFHAEGYNRTRGEHLEFGKWVVKEFDDLLENRPENFTRFQEEMSRRLGVPVNG